MAMKRILSSGLQNDNSCCIYQLELKRHQTVLSPSPGCCSSYCWLMLHPTWCSPPINTWPVTCSRVSNLSFKAHFLCVLNFLLQQKHDLLTSFHMEVSFNGSHVSPCISPAVELLLICGSVLVACRPPPAQPNLCLTCSFQQWL